MSELTNSMTPEQIKGMLGLCSNGICIDECPCYGLKHCEDVLMHEANFYIWKLENERPKWISVEEQLPEEEGDYLVRKVHSYSDKDGYSKIDVCVYCRMRDPEWIGCGNLCKVTHWMPLPEPPKGEEE